MDDELNNSMNNILEVSVFCYAITTCIIQIFKGSNSYLIIIMAVLAFFNMILPNEYLNLKWFPSDQNKANENLDYD